MSYDRQLEQVCTHEVVDELLYLSEDRRTIIPLRPISNVNSVSVRLNGVADVTAAGLAIGATAKGQAPGPFNIRAGVNDTLTFSVNGGLPQTIVAAAGNGVSSSALAKDLSTKATNVTFQVTQRGQIQVTTRALGPDSSLQFFATASPLSATLGIITNRIFRGQQIVPRWSLVNDPNTLSDRPTRLILFDDRIEGTSDYVEIGYTVLRQECRRCGGMGVENDWRYDIRGNVLQVRNYDLLIQEITKITYTQKGSNPFFDWYGTNLVESIGKKLSHSGIVQNLIISDVRDAFKNWQSVKKQQEEKVQAVSDEEYPARILSVTLTPDPSDPTVLYVNAEIQSRSSQPIQISRGLKLPLPYDILGSTVQEALLRENPLS